jgi:hypothetical protein
VVGYDWQEGILHIMQFYSVKERRMVEVPREQVRARKYEHLTKSGKRQVRYALQADYNGQRLISIARPKFIFCPPPLGSPRFARGTARGAPTRFPLRAADKGTSVGYKKSAAWGKFHPL